MSQQPVDTETTRGYQPPHNTQFSIFLDNQVGKLLSLVQIFEGQALEVVAISVMDSADYAVVRLLTSRSVLARRLLVRNCLPFSEKDILVVELGQEQTLGKLCVALLSAEINIHYAYPLMTRPRGAAAIALYCDHLQTAGDVLLRKRFTLLAENDLGENQTGSGADAEPT
jgi:hypothetical protein